MNKTLFRELCEQAIETNDPRFVSEISSEIARVLDAKRRQLNLARRKANLRDKRFETRNKFDLKPPGDTA